MLDRFGEWLIMLLLLVGGGGGEVPPAAPAPLLPPSERATHTVAHVIDGDTVILENGERVRLLGIDTPEREECYYQPSQAFLRAWVEGKPVQLEHDQRNRDDYGRLLRYIYVGTEPDGTATSTPQLVNQTLLQQGYATVLPIGDDRRYRSQFYAAEESAQAAARGRWSACEE